MKAPPKSSVPYWYRGLDRSTVTRPTVEEFVRELNRHVQAYGLGSTGVRFLSRSDAKGSIFVGWSGPDSVQGVVRRVLDEVTQAMPMPAPFQVEPVPPATS